MSLLTESQLIDWRERVHTEYVTAGLAMKRAIRREKLYRRYVLRHVTEQDMIRAERAGVKQV